MPIYTPNINASDEIENLIVSVKADDDFWNEDPAERAKDTYTGFRMIRNNRLSRAVDASDFPILFLDAHSPICIESNRESFAVSEHITVQVSAVYSDDDTLVASNTKKIEVLLFSVLRTFGLQAVGEVLFFEDVYNSVLTHNIAVKVELC